MQAAALGHTGLVIGFFSPFSLLQLPGTSRTSEEDGRINDGDARTREGSYTFRMGDGRLNNRGRRESLGRDAGTGRSIFREDPNYRFEGSGKAQEGAQVRIILRERLKG